MIRQSRIAYSFSDHKHGNASMQRGGGHGGVEGRTWKCKHDSPHDVLPTLFHYEVVL